MIVGFSGRIGAGKSTAAALLRDRYGFAVVSFAAPMKAAVMAMFGWGPERLQGAQKERVDPKWGISPRQALQALGTEFAQSMLGELYPAYRRTTGRLLWVKRALTAIRPEDRVAIDDVRFPHEANAIRYNRGYIIEVQRPGYPPETGHASERQSVVADMVVENTGGVEELAERIGRVLDPLLSGPFR